MESLRERCRNKSTGVSASAKPTFPSEPCSCTACPFRVSHLFAENPTQYSEHSKLTPSVLVAERTFLAPAAPWDVEARKHAHPPAVFRVASPVNLQHQIYVKDSYTGNIAGTSRAFLVLPRDAMKQIAVLSGWPYYAYPASLSPRSSLVFKASGLTARPARTKLDAEWRIQAYVINILF
jgi:hypothetical protein